MHPATHGYLLSEGVVRLCFDGVLAQLAPSSIGAPATAACLGVLTNLAFAEPAHGDILAAAGVRLPGQLPSTSAGLDLIFAAMSKCVVPAQCSARLCLRVFVLLLHSTRECISV